MPLHYDPEIMDGDGSLNEKDLLNRNTSLPDTSATRLALSETTLTSPIPAMPSPMRQLKTTPGKPETMLYLAYGSNLATSVFRGARQIRPLSAVLVHAPSLELTFDLTFMPYTEPCMGNVGLRKLPPAPKPPQPPLPLLPGPNPRAMPSNVPLSSESLAEFTAGEELRQSSPENEESSTPGEWDLGLIGVVYEVTVADYHQIILTEGGGSAYEDILVPCFTIPRGTKSVPAIPSGMPFLAHTLCAPGVVHNPVPIPQPNPDPSPPPQLHQLRQATTDVEQANRRLSVSTGEKGQVRRQILVPMPRPKKGYAQPSVRYLNLIKVGAEEQGVPTDYQRYLATITPYEPTTRGQKIGRWIVWNIWRSGFLLIIQFGRKYGDEQGHWPWRLVVVAAWYFGLLWKWYDWLAQHLLGDGERTIEHECLHSKRDSDRLESQTLQSSRLLGDW